MSMRCVWVCVRGLDLRSHPLCVYIQYSVVYLRLPREHMAQIMHCNLLHLLLFRMVS